MNSFSIYRKKLLNWKSFKFINIGFQRESRGIFTTTFFTINEELET
jgi:hypothetical protein